VVEAYRAAKEEDRSRRPLTGVQKLDEITGGFGPGEMVVIAAASGTGKSQSCVSIAYHAAAIQGLHVYFATSETVRNTVRWRTVARHSRADKFTELREHLSIPHGLDSNLLKRGSLPDNLLEFFVLVAQDLARIEGSLWIAQMPYGHTVEALDAQVRQRSRARSVDLLVVDYLALMSVNSSKRYGSTREDYVDIIKGCKHLAVDYNRGNGLTLTTPWQLTRQCQEEMDRTGEINTRGLADTSEIVNTPDIIVTLSPDGSRNGRFAPMRMGLLKNRDGMVLLGGDAIPVQMDYATSYLSARMSAESNSDVWGSSVESDISSLLGGLV
jgi:replicative DNA helicase